MADDIDDLLDEVEDTFLNKNKAGKKKNEVIETKNVAPNKARLVTFLIFQICLFYS